MIDPNKYCLIVLPFDIFAINIAEQEKNHYSVVVLIKKMKKKKNSNKFSTVLIGSNYLTLKSYIPDNGV